MSLITKFKYILLSIPDSTKSEESWLVKFDAPLKIILTARFFSAFLVHITDCDETFNYWEPVNFTDPLLYFSLLY